MHTHAHIYIYIYMVTPPYDPARVCFLRKNHGFMHIYIYMSRYLLKGLQGNYYLKGLGTQ